jgi:hypothetical protein
LDGRGGGGSRARGEGTGGWVDAMMVRRREGRGRVDAGRWVGVGGWEGGREGTWEGGRVKVRERSGGIQGMGGRAPAP